MANKQTIFPIPAAKRATYERQGVAVDTVIAEATSDQCEGVTINAGRARHSGRASILYMEAWLASMKVNGIPAQFARNVSA